MGLLTDSFKEKLTSTLLSSDPRMSSIRTGMLEKLGPMAGKRPVAPTFGELAAGLVSGKRQGEKDYLQEQLATTDYMTNDMGDIIKIDKIKGTTETIQEGKKIKTDKRKVPFRKNGEQWERYETGVSEDGGRTWEWTTESEYKRFADKGPFSVTGKIKKDFLSGDITEDEMNKELLSLTGVKDPATQRLIEWIAKEKFAGSETPTADAIDLYFSRKDKSFREFKSEMLTDAMKSTVGIDWRGDQGTQAFKDLEENMDYMAKKIYYEPKPVPPNPTPEIMVDKEYYETIIDGKNKILQWNKETKKLEEINVRK